MDKLRVFISSRVEVSFKGVDEEFLLKDLRKHIKTTLDNTTLFGEQILVTITNEQGFNGTFKENAYDTTFSNIRKSNIIIILYNGQAGWAKNDDDGHNGICYDEFQIAMNEFSDMTFILNLSGYFTSSKSNKKDENFQDFVNKLHPPMETISSKTVDVIKDTVVKQIQRFILEAIQKSFETQKMIVAGASVYGPTLDWRKLDYTQRVSELNNYLSLSFNNSTYFTDVIKEYYAIPDNMSVSDARNLIGRPFINENELLDSRPETSGAIHFVAVYGNATEMQVKNLIGYPDLTIIKTSFGYYLWDKSMQIQMFILKQCINPDTVKMRYTQVANWLTSSGEQSKVLVRAKARYSILSAINKAKKSID